MDLLEMLTKATRDNPVKREDIRREYNCSDRCARRMIEDLRDKGHRVVGISDYKGYWIAKSEAEFNVFLGNYEAKAYKILARSKKMKDRVPEQIEMEKLKC